MEKIPPVMVRVQGMVCELLADTKARFESVVEWLEEQAKDEQASLEKENHIPSGNPAMYQDFLDHSLEHMAEVKHGIAGLETLLVQAKELHQNITAFWEQYNKASDERLERRKAA